MVSKDSGDGILVALEMDTQEGDHTLDELLHESLAVLQCHAQYLLLVVRFNISRQVLEAPSQLHHMLKSHLSIMKIVLGKLAHKRRKLDVEHLRSVTKPVS